MVPKELRGEIRKTRALALVVLSVGCLATLTGIALGQGKLKRRFASVPTGIPTVTQDGTLTGMQADFLRAPIERWYVDAAPDTTSLSKDNLELTNLSVGTNQRLYPKLDRVRESIASDRALSAFLNSPEHGTLLRAAFNHVTLYASLPRPGQDGFNEYNALITPFGGRGQGKNRLKALKAQAGNKRNAAGDANPQNPVMENAPGSETPQEPTKNAPRQPGFLGDLQDVKAPTGNAKPQAGAFLAQGQRARQAFPTDFTAFVSLSPDGRMTTLYVLGSLPANLNSTLPINFTVQAKGYDAGDGDALDSGDRAQRSTLIDKQTLAPNAGRYFCFVYPLATPPSGAQTNLLVSYWLDPSIALTHGVALAPNGTRTASNAAEGWIAVPMTRLQRFVKDYRYAIIRDTVVGEPLSAALTRKKK